MSAVLDTGLDVGPEDIAAVEDAARRFIRTEVAPHLNDWEEAGEFPRALYQRAADLGWLGLGFPKALGGTPAQFSQFVQSEHKKWKTIVLESGASVD